ncbi:6338_t:CDS:2, partial [Gigaspora margarita]
VIIADVEFELPKNLQKHLRKAISNIKNITNHNDLEKYYKKINKQLNYFKEFDKKALNISDFIHIIDSAFSLIEKLKKELLTEVDNIRKHLTKKSKELDNILYLNKEDIKKKIEKGIYHIIQLKSVYNLTTGLEHIRSRLELFDPTFIQKILDFYEKLIYELELNNDLIKIFRENEPYVKDYCLNLIIKNLAKIDCLVDNFYKHIIAKTYDKIEFERMNK